MSSVFAICTLRADEVQIGSGNITDKILVSDGLSDRLETEILISNTNRYFHDIPPTIPEDFP